jgi:hypothetical protein
MRRYPALGFLVAAALLASLLPSALRLPLSGPAATAELAPVPGKSSGSQGDLSSLGETSTGGLGAGSGAGSGAGGAGGASLPPEDNRSHSPPPGRGTDLSDKRCTGVPRRQTEDPMSPPCVALFSGDNFGSTWKGVTRDEVKVAINLGCDSDGGFRLLDDDDHPALGYHWYELMNYFNDRFQTYGRRVHLYVVVPHANGGGKNYCVGGGDDAAAVKAMVQGLDEQLGPFYIGLDNATNFGSEVLSAEAAHHQIVSESATPTAAFTTANSPYVVGYNPSVEGLAAQVVSSVCAMLAGRPARFGEPEFRTTTRKFGLFYFQAGDRDSRGAALIKDGIGRNCGDKAGDIVMGPVGRTPTANDYPAMRAAGVTTVLWAVQALVPFFGGAGGWNPEWFFANEVVGNNFVTRPYAASFANSFGLMFDRRRGPLRDQPEYIALKEVCADCNFSSADLQVYRRLLLLFTGIQAAGPRLTPTSFDKGLHVLPAHPAGDPFAPAAYFGPGDHTFLKDFALAWWDPSGRPPGESSAKPGCWRLVDDGHRYRAEDWSQRQGDAGIQQLTPEQPCQGENQELSSDSVKDAP